METRKHIAAEKKRCGSHNCAQAVLHTYALVSKGGQQQFNTGAIKKIRIPLPPLSEQQRIVSILDTFEASISNLEAQLAQRQKQYEYYRNQLLTIE